MPRARRRYSNSLSFDPRTLLFRMTGVDDAVAVLVDSAGQLGTTSSSRRYKEEIEEICGGAPEKPDFGEKVVAAIKWVDGTVIDTVYQVAE